MRRSKSLVLWLMVSMIVAVLAGGAIAAEKKKNPLEAWKPAFDPSGAKYVMKVSNVSHPVIQGVAAGYRIRDRLWEETNGQIYFDYYPLSQLGGEVEVFNQLMMGAIQGMLGSSVAATNIAPGFGVVNLPFLVNSFDKLDKFAENKELFDHFLASAESKGVMGVDITGYGNYGWATTKPVKTLADAKPLKLVDQKCEALIASMQKHKILEKIKYKERLAYQRKLMQDEYKLMDELASIRHARKT